MVPAVFRILLIVMQVVNVTTWDKNGFEPTQVLQRLSDLIWRGRVAGFTLLQDPNYTWLSCGSRPFSSFLSTITGGICQHFSLNYNLIKHGGKNRGRTYDAHAFNVTLYQLSYLSSKIWRDGLDSNQRWGFNPRG